MKNPLRITLLTMAFIKVSGFCGSKYGKFRNCWIHFGFKCTRRIELPIFGIFKVYMQLENIAKVENRQQQQKFLHNNSFFPPRGW